MIMENVLSRARLQARSKMDAGTGGRELRLGFREAILLRWLRGIEVGRLTVEFPSGVRQSFGGEDAACQASVKIHDLRVVFRMLVGGDMGLAEGYLEGEWDTPDLTSLLMLGMLNREALSGAIGGSWAATILNRIRHARRANTRAGSRRNIAAHYDLGNEFYRLWLDESMTYSSALFAGEDDSLPEAQRRKYLRLAEKLDLRPGDRVLEIGCGWGGFAEIAAAEFGCQVVGLTLSKEQAGFARSRMAQAGLTKQVDIWIQDYRDVRGDFDKIVSIEMFEAVGQENWGTYFAVLDRCLKPGGRAALQSITIADEHFESYRQNPEFIQRYIFPGGMLPGPAVFEKAVCDAGLVISDAFYFGRSYAETLRYWTRAFQENWPAVEALGFDQRFRRMWDYYLCYCEVGFEQGQIDLGQFILERK